MPNCRPLEDKNYILYSNEARTFDVWLFLIIKSPNLKVDLEK